MTPKALLHGAKDAKEEDQKSFLCGPFDFAQDRLGVPSAEFILTKEGLRTGLARKTFRIPRGKPRGYPIIIQ